MLKKIKAHYNNLQGKHFVLAFKFNIDAIIEEQALSIIDSLTNTGPTVTAYGPNVKVQIENKINYAENKYQVLAGAKDLIIAAK